jgi:3-phosphoshikimate 1-carboxyvinyltransferase
MRLQVENTPQLSGILSPPSSKSQNIRAALFASLASGNSILHNPLESDDTTDIINMVKAFGVEVNVDKQRILLNSTGIPFQTNNTEFYSGNSGLTTLFSLPFLGLRHDTDTTVSFDCGEQMRARPVAPLVDALNQLGMQVDYLQQQEKCPLSVSGALQGGKATVDGFNSQYLSALLISLPCAPNDSEISVNHLHERPYIEMTLSWLNKQNIVYRHEQRENTDIFYIQGNQRYLPFTTYIPVDFSSASCLIAAAALISGKVVFKGLDMNEPQSDKALIPILQQMGADLVIEDDQLTIHGGKPLTGIEIDANDFPDLIPALAIIASQAAGKTRIYNVAHARIKETDRIHSMAEGLTAMGAMVETFADGMTIWQSQLKGANIKGFGDHRTVMSLSIAGLLATGETVIDDAEAINKTFPGFVEVMRDLGAEMQLAPNSP